MNLFSAPQLKRHPLGGTLVLRTQAKIVRLPIVAFATFVLIAIILDLGLSRVGESPSIPGQSLVLFAAIPGSMIRSLFYGVHGAPADRLNNWVLAVGSALVWTPACCCAAAARTRVRMAQGPTVEVLHTLRPLVVVMAGADEFDPYED